MDESDQLRDRVTEEVYSDLRSLEDCRGLSLQNIQVVPLQTLAHSEVYRTRVDSSSTSLILKNRAFPTVLVLPNWFVPKCRLIVDGDNLADKLFIEDLADTHPRAISASPPVPNAGA